MTNEQLADKLYCGCDEMSELEIAKELAIVDCELSKAEKIVAKADKVMDFLFRTGQHGTAEYQQCDIAAAYWKTRAERLYCWREDLLEALFG